MCSLLDFQSGRSEYKTDQDERPLKALQIGQGNCDPYASGSIVKPESCGGNKRGRCTKGKVCECNKGWVGPHCLASEGHDTIDWDEPDKLSDVGFVPPHIVSNGLLIGLAAVVLVLLVAAKWRKQLEGWTPIPDVELSGKI